MLPRSKSLRFMIAAGLAATTAPALAVGQPVVDAQGRIYGDASPDLRPEWKQAPMSMPAMPPAQTAAPIGHPGYDMAAFEDAKADWLHECRRRHGGKGGVAGGVIGGIVGGAAGAAIAGRGNRTVGAIAGGAIGAVAGVAIGSSADRRRARDYCEGYLEDYLARQQYGAGYVQPGYAMGYAMQPVMMMMPVTMVQAAAPAADARECKETIVTEEWVEVRRPARRYIPQRRIVPDKRIRIN